MLNIDNEVLLFLELRWVNLNLHKIVLVCWINFVVSQTACASAAD